MAAPTTDLRRRLPRGRYYFRAVVCLGIFKSLIFEHAICGLAVRRLY